MQLLQLHILNDHAFLGFFSPYGLLFITYFSTASFSVMQFLVLCEFVISCCFGITLYHKLLTD